MAQPIQKSGGAKPKARAVRIMSLMPNPKDKDEGNEQVTLANTTKKNVSLRGWSLRDKGRNTLTSWLVRLRRTAA
jgi:hypothetical protein